MNVAKGMDQRSEVSVGHFVAQHLAADVRLAVGQDIEVAEGMRRAVGEENVDLWRHVLVDFLGLMRNPSRRQKLANLSRSHMQTHLLAAFVVPGPATKDGTPGTPVDGPLSAAQLKLGGLVLEVAVLLVGHGLERREGAAHRSCVCRGNGILFVDPTADAAVPVVAGARSKVVVARDDELVRMGQRCEPRELVLKGGRRAQVGEIAAVEQSILTMQRTQRRALSAPRLLLSLTLLLTPSGTSGCVECVSLTKTKRRCFGDGLGGGCATSYSTCHVRPRNEVAMFACCLLYYADGGKPPCNISGPTGRA